MSIKSISRALVVTAVGGTLAFASVGLATPASATGIVETGTPVIVHSTPAAVITPGKGASLSKAFTTSKSTKSKKSTVTFPKMKTPPKAPKKAAATWAKPKHVVKPSR